jgi:hypothetical protein
MGEVWYREEIKITIHFVNIKYLVHSIEWGLTPRTMMFVVPNGLFIFSNILAIRRYHIEIEIVSYHLLGATEGNHKEPQ